MVNIKVLASGSRGNCYLIDDNHTKILLECGIPWKEIQRGLDFKTSEIKGCLVSHEHGDHAKAIFDITKAGIDCYLTKPTADAIGINGHRIKYIEPLKQFTVESFIILPFEVEHDAQCPVGFLIKSKSTGQKTLFLTDSYYCKYRFSGLNYIMIECNYATDILQANVERGAVPVALKNRLLKSHFSLENVKEFLQANDLSKVQEIWLIHLSDGNSDVERFKREIQEVTGKAVYVA